MAAMDCVKIREDWKEMRIREGMDVKNRGRCHSLTHSWMVCLEFLSSPIQSLSFIGKGLGFLVLGMGAVKGIFALVTVMHM